MKKAVCDDRKEYRRFFIKHSSVKNKQRTVRSLTASAIAVAFAYLFGMADKFETVGHLFGLMRVLIYFALFAAWILRVKRTVQQQATRRYLLISGVLMIFWLYIRSIKLEFVLSPVEMRACWYLYYLPMLFIPVAALLAALTIGKADGEGVGAKAKLLWLVSAALLLVVLTNDLHQLVFRFPADVPAALRSDSTYSYGPMYMVAVGWMALCGIAATYVMYNKCRMPNSKKYFSLALLPIALALVYTGVYVTGVSWLRFWLGDMTVVHCLLITAAFEWCIICGMIRSNSMYAELFEVSADCSAQIADRSFSVRYSARDALPVTKEQIKSAVSAPLFLADGTTLYTMPVSGGYAVWTEDNSDLLAQEEELKDLREEWQERNELLRSEYTMEEKRRKIAEQNRLYDLLQEVTQKQLDKIARLMQVYQGEKRNSDGAKAVLAKIAVLCSYIKRRKHLELLADREYTVSREELQMAFSESLRTLGLLGVESSLFVDTEKQINGNTAAGIYDFFEDVLEADMDGLRSLDVRAVRRSDGLRITVTAECDADLSLLSEQYPQAEFEKLDGEQTCLITLDAGGDEG